MSLVDLMAQNRDEIRELGYDGFVKKYPRLKMLGGKFDELFKMYESHKWLSYSAEAVMHPEFHKLSDYITSMQIHGSDYVMPDKRTFLPFSAEVYTTRFKVFRDFPEYDEMIGSHVVSVKMRYDLNVGVSPSNWTSITFHNWYEGYGLLVINTDVCAQGWLGFCTKQSILDLLIKIRKQNERC